MNWINFPAFAGAAFGLWAFAGASTIKKNKITNILLHATTLLGIAVMGYFITSLWLYLDRPPMRTLGETRLWYAFFLPIIGYLIYLRWKYTWFLLYSLGMAMVFLTINLLNPDTYDKTLMPALQSVWFVPHVVVYIFAYAVLAASSVAAGFGVYKLNKTGDAEKEIKLADNLVYIGTAFLTMGLLFGALWAKKAWGHYWTWDPKETWAFLTWSSYLFYMHFRYYHPAKTKTHLWILVISFFVLMVCWFGINYLPSAQNSVHVYTKTS